MESRDLYGIFVLLTAAPPGLARLRFVPRGGPSEFDNQRNLAQTTLLCANHYPLVAPTSGEYQIKRRHQLLASSPSWHDEYSTVTYRRSYWV